VIPVTNQNIQAAGTAFDNVVVDIEDRFAREIAAGDDIRVWAPNCREEDDVRGVRLAILLLEDCG
jgi:hypothetical protein